MRDHLRADLGHQGGLARFLENHDEPRAAGTFPWERHQAAAVLTFLAPVLRFFHPGQFEGRTRHVPVHFDRAPAEPADPAVRAFYERLLEVLRDPLPRGGDWRLLEPREAWSGNPSHDGFIAYAWRSAEAGERLLVAVNYRPTQGQCHLPMSGLALLGPTVHLADRLGPARYERAADDLTSPGLSTSTCPPGAITPSASPTPARCLVLG